VATTGGEKRLLPVPRPFDVWGSTSVVDLLTAKPTYEANPDKCPINRVVCDTDSWEQKMAQVLESMAEVKSYAKNQGMGFSIPYVFKGRERQYFPDFIARVDDGQADLLNLIVEVSGLPKEEKAVKITTARELWVPAVNNHSAFGRWAFLNITDPWNGESAIRDYLRERDTELAGAPMRAALRS
jgi:type III restriction enzyme